MDINGYILITPLKNECKNIKNMVNSIVNQTIKPLLWVIVNDNSTDCSKKLLLKYSKQHNFIKIIDFPIKVNKYDVGIHYSEVCKFGFDYAIRYAEKYNILYEYIGLMDADINVEKHYFEKLINYFQKDKNLGILGGVIYSWDGKKYILEPYRRNSPRGAVRLWRKVCFLDTKGYLITYSPDTVSNIKAIMRGWKILTYPYAIAYQTRLTSSAGNIYLRWRKNGESDYYLYKSPIIAILKCTILILQGKIIEGIGYLCGYFTFFIKRKERIEDEDVKYYSSNCDTLMKRLLKKCV